MHSKVSGGSNSNALNDSGALQQGPASGTQNVGQDKDCNEEDMLSRELDEALLGEDVTIPLAQYSPSHQDRGKSGRHDIASGSDANPTEVDYASSPLPPSSPLPASPFSSPAKHFGAQTINDIAVPDSGMLLPSASDSDGPRKAADATWLSDDASTAAAWFTDSEASAWLTETEAWLTDTEGGGGGPLLTGSDGTGTWLSDSDAVFGDMSSLASNWLSDDADVDTDDGELGAMGGQGQDGGFDTTAFQMAYAALVERGRNVIKDGPQGGGALSAVTHAHDTQRVVESGSGLFWECMQPLLGGGRGALNDDTGTAPEVAQDIQALLDETIFATNVYPTK